MATSAISTQPAALRQPAPGASGRPVQIANQRFYWPELDLLRFFAFLCVFLHHGLPAFEPATHVATVGRILGIWNDARSAGGFGVCLFFLLSAFLITDLLERERLRTGRIHARSFYLRRILRIWPLYFAFVGAVALVSAQSADRVEAGRLLALLLLAGNWYTAAKGCASNGLAPLWSISVEEQFYLVWPLLAKLGGRKTLLWVSVLLVPVSWTAILLLSYGSHSNLSAWVNSFVQFQFFGLGAILALSLRRKAPRFSMSQRLVLFTGGLFAWYLAQALFHVKDDSRVLSAKSSIPGYSLVAAGCVLLLFAFLGIAEQFVPKRLAYFGKISYGLYVFHLFALEHIWKLGETGILQFGSSGAIRAGVYLIFCVTALALTITLAMLSYRFLERPFLRIKERFAFVQSRGI